MQNFITQEIVDNFDLIRRILANSGLTEIQNITRLPSGSRSIAYYADNYIVRFPKAEIIWQTMQREKTIIDSIYPHLVPYFKNKIHKIELIDGVFPFSISEKFYGKICDSRPESQYAVPYQSLNAAQQKKLAQNLAIFFHLMHQIDYEMLNIPMPTEVIDNWNVCTKENFDYAQVRQVLLTYHIDLDDYKTASPNLEKALCHNDLSGSNLLLNPKNEDILVGIIDFGNVVVMPKYLDFFPLYKIHRQLAADTLQAYNELTNASITQKQIDFSALNYIGYGLAQNKNNPSPYFMKLLTSFY